MKTQFYDLSIDTLDDGTIRLEQRDYCGESVIVDLHPQQILHIANGLSVDTHQAQPNGSAERIATLERRLLWMRDRFDECHAALPSDMFERCAEAPEFYAWLQASLDVSAEFCADIAGVGNDFPIKPLPSPSVPFGDGHMLMGAAGCADGHPEQPNGDLFAGSA